MASRDVVFARADHKGAPLQWTNGSPKRRRAIVGAHPTSVNLIQLTGSLRCSQPSEVQSIDLI